MTSLGIAFLVCGLIVLAGAGLQWKWFMQTKRVQRMVRLMGTGKTRFVYAVIGLFLTLLGALLTFGPMLRG
jgi:hypothetical protein